MRTTLIQQSQFKLELHKVRRLFLFRSCPNERETLYIVVHFAMCFILNVETYTAIPSRSVISIPDINANTEVIDLRTLVTYGVL